MAAEDRVFAERGKQVPGDQARQEAFRLSSEIRTLFTRGVADLLEGGIGPAAANGSAAGSEKWRDFETLSTRAAFVASLLDSLRSTSDSSYFRNVARALKILAPDAPTLDPVDFRG